jgi:hypothetical protein
MPVNDSFGAEITYSVDGSDTLTFRDISDFESAPPVEVSSHDYINNMGGNGTCRVFDYNANVDFTAKEFVNVTAVQISRITTIVATETEVNNAIFNGTFTVTDRYVDPVDAVKNQTVDICQYQPDHPENAIRAEVRIPSGFSGDLTFRDSIVSDDEADGTCFYPVTGALKITGPLTVQPEIWLSYENANFTGVAAGNSQFELGMYYKHPGEQFEIITLPAISGDFFEFIDPDVNHEGTIKSKNSGDTGSTTGPGVLDPGGWAGITDYQGEYVLGIENGCGGGGGGGLVRPSLVVNALAGVSGISGGGADGSPPFIELSELVKFSHLEIPLEIEEKILNHDSAVPISPMEVGLFENFDYPMTINDQGFVLGGFTSTIQTQSIKTNSTSVIKFILYDTTEIQHLSLYTNLRDANSQIHQSDTQILYNHEQPLQIIDPNGFFSDVTVTINEINENKKEAIFEITFAKEMAKSDVIVRSWDPFFNSRDVFILDAFEVVPEIVIESPIPTFEEPVVEELRSQTIPIWIKNNAAWWSEQQISDSDFVAGIEYLITNGIIIVPGVEVGAITTSEIPDWVQNNAGWWAESLITDEDFVEAMQWLVANGVIQI